MKQEVRNIIQVPPSHSIKMADEFGKSRQTIYNALRGITQTKLAKQIRRRAKELLLEESKAIQI